MAMPQLSRPRWIGSPWFLLALIAGVAGAILPGEWPASRLTLRAGVAFLCGLAMAAAWLAWLAILVGGRWEILVESALRPQDPPRELRRGRHMALYLVFFVPWYWAEFLLVQCFNRPAWSAGFWYFLGAFLGAAALIVLYWRVVWRRAWEIYRERQGRPQHPTPAA